MEARGCPRAVIDFPFRAPPGCRLRPRAGPSTPVAACGSLVRVVHRCGTVMLLADTTWRHYGVRRRGHPGRVADRNQAAGLAVTPRTCRSLGEGEPHDRSVLFPTSA